MLPPISIKRIVIVVVIMVPVLFFSIGTVAGPRALPGDAFHGYKLWIEDIVSVGTIDKLETRLVELDHLLTGLAPAGPVLESLRLIARTAGVVQCLSWFDSGRLNDLQDYFKAIIIQRADIAFRFYAPESLQSIRIALIGADDAVDNAITHQYSC